MRTCLYTWCLHVLSVCHLWMMTLEWEMGMVLIPTLRRQGRWISVSLRPVEFLGNQDCTLDPISNTRKKVDPDVPKTSF